LNRGTVIRRGSTYSVVLDLGKGPDGKRIRKWHSGYQTKPGSTVSVSVWLVFG
jgi:hypothetical protein